MNARGSRQEVATGDPREVRGAVAEQVQDSYLHYVGSGVQAPYGDGTMGETWGTLEKPCGIIRGMIEGRWTLWEAPRVQGGSTACAWRVFGVRLALQEAEVGMIRGWARHL